MIATLSQRGHKSLTNHMLWRYPELGTLVFGVLVVFLGLGTVWPVLTLYMEDKGVGVGEIGVTTAAWMGANFLFQVPMGWLSDRIGRKPVLLFGLAVNGLISLSFLFITDPSYFLILRFLEGVGGAAMMPAARAYIMDTMPSDVRGQAFGFLNSALNVGTLIGPAVGGLMVGFTGMTGPFWFGFGSSIIAGIFLITTLHEKRGAAKVAADKAIAESSDGGPAKLSWRAVLPVFITAGGSGIAFGLFSVLWNIWLHDMGADLNLIGLSYTVFALPLVLAGPWAGRLADKRSRVLLILAPSLINAVIYLSWGFTTNLPLIIGLGVVEGFMIAIMGPANDSYMADVTPAPLRGRLQGIANSATTAVGFVSAIGCGVLYQQNPTSVFVILAVGVVLTGVAASLLMVPVERTLRPGGKPHVQQEATNKAQVSEEKALAL